MFVLWIDTTCLEIYFDLCHVSFILFFFGHQATNGSKILKSRDFCVSSLLMHSLTGEGKKRKRKEDKRRMERQRKRLKMILAVGQTVHIRVKPNFFNF